MQRIVAGRFAMVNNSPRPPDGLHHAILAVVVAGSIHA
jgi:hypothetical protein